MMDQENNENNGSTPSAQPYVRIIEQPSKFVRFRYECEGRSAGRLEGEKTTDSRKTYPAIKIENYQGPAFIVVSCVSKDPPHYPHPHNLVGPSKQVSKGICFFKIESDEMTVGFKDVGIQCVTRKAIKKSLEVRESLRVDPFNTGFDQNPDDMDLYCLRLCFQVFLPGKVTDKFDIALQPVVSDQIHDKRLKVEPYIDYLSHNSASAAGGTEICILCEKAMKDDIEVVFFRKENNWEAVAELTPPMIYKQLAIVFKSPKYVEPDITEPVTVQVQLRRISDKSSSAPLSFKLMPADRDAVLSAKRKRPFGKFAIARRIQAEVSKNVDLVNFTSSQSGAPSEPWRSPTTKFIAKPVDPSKPFIPVVTIRNNELNAMRYEHLRPATLTNGLNYNDNMQNAAFDYSMKATDAVPQQPQTNAVYQPLRTLKTEVPSDTLADDGWIKDIANTLDPNDSSQPTPPTASIDMNNVAYEPETKFIHSDQIAAQNTLVNGQEINNPPTAEGPNISELAASISGNLSNINFADLIDVVDINNEMAGAAGVDNNTNGLNLDYTPSLTQGEDDVQNLPIEIPIEALKPPYLLTK